MGARMRGHRVSATAAALHVFSVAQASHCRRLWCSHVCLGSIVRKSCCMQDEVGGDKNRRLLTYHTLAELQHRLQNSHNCGWNLFLHFLRVQAAKNDMLSIVQ